MNVEVDLLERNNALLNNHVNHSNKENTNEKNLTVYLQKNFDKKDQRYISKMEIEGGNEICIFILENFSLSTNFKNINIIMIISKF